jgi:hypothetical protein
LVDCPKKQCLHSSNLKVEYYGSSYHVPQVCIPLECRSLWQAFRFSFPLIYLFITGMLLVGALLRNVGICVVIILRNRPNLKILLNGLWKWGQGQVAKSDQSVTNQWNL